jgi:hypothetical protein
MIWGKRSITRLPSREKMIQLLARAPAIQDEVIASHLLAAVEANEQAWLTGLVEISLTPAMRVVLLLVEGTALDTYLVTEMACEQISLARLAELLPAGSLMVRTLALPLEGVRMAQMLLEWHPPIETILTTTAAIPKYLDGWHTDPASYIVHIIWPDAEGLVALPGGAVFVSGERVEVGDAGLAAIATHPASGCTLTRYAARTAASRREQTIPLHTAFVLLINSVLERYTELVGFKLADALAFDFNRKADRKGWHIKLTTNGVTDTHGFATPDAAASAYRSLIGNLIEHMTVVIGARLARAVILEAVSTLDFSAQQILQTYSMVPSGSVTGGAAIRR